MVEVTNQLPVQKLVRLTAKPGRELELRNALRILESATRNERGCLEFTLLQSISNEASFVLLEHFTNQEAFNVHMQLPHTQTFFEAQLVASITATDVPYLGGT